MEGDGMAAHHVELNALREKPSDTLYQILVQLRCALLRPVYR